MSHALIALTSPNTSGVLIKGNSYSNSGLVDNSAQYGLFIEATSANNIQIIGNVDRSGGVSVDYYRGCRLASCLNVSFEQHTITPLYAKTNVEYFQLIDSNYVRIVDSYIKGRDTTDPNGTAIVAMFGSSSNCQVLNNRFDGTGTTQGVVYLEQSSYTGTGNLVAGNIITSSASANAIVLKTGHFGTVVGANQYTSGRVSNVSGGLQKCYQDVSAIDATVVHCYGVAAPTTGTWAAGSRVYNAATGTTDYWECTVAGTPGTWVARN